MRNFKGTPYNLNKTVMGIVTRNPSLLKRKDRILLTEEAPMIPIGFKGILTIGRGSTGSIPTVQIQADDLNFLNEGDCVSFQPDGTVSVVWENNAQGSNSLLLTEACDCKCIMCPQPPKAHDKTLFENCHNILNLINPDTAGTICITGGEPTLLKEDFFSTLKLINKKCPNNLVILLTNGKSFSDFEFTKKFAFSKPANLLTCVSLHADVAEIHDKIAGVNNSFYKTLMGLQNLARFRQLVEIRIVINKLNASRLESIANFIIRNFPFITHCAFMGMEITGCAKDNYSDIWIDPIMYQAQLYGAVKTISRAHLSVSIYNIPLCLLGRSAWGFARKSISEWKNGYLLICNDCSVKSMCCGVFTTSGSLQSVNIKPFTCK